MRKREFVEFGNGHGVEAVGAEEKARVVFREFCEIFFLERAVTCEDVEQETFLFESLAERGYRLHGHRVAEVAAVVDQQRDFAGVQT